MKTILAIALLALCGCATITKTAIDEANQVQLLLGALLPPDFKGDFSDTESNMYFNYTFEAGGLHLIDAVDQFGKPKTIWAFTWLYFDGSSSVPLTPALAWTGHHHIALGTRPTLGGVPLGARVDPAATPARNFPVTDKPIAP